MRRKRRKISWFRLTLIILLFPIIFVWLIYRKIKFSKERNNDNIDIFNISQVDSLSGVEFENLLMEIFEKQGYRVSPTKASHDYGADLILSKNGRISIVQAKCYSKNIGIKSVQEIIAAKRHYNADEMFVATNRYFSKEAIILASEHEVRLIDRDVILNLVRDYSPKIKLAEKRYVATNSEEKQKIQEKYKYWI